MSKDEWKKLTKNVWKKWVVVVGRMLLAYALVFAQGAWATQNQATKDKAASPQKAAQQTSEKQPSVATGAKGQTAQAQSEESESGVAEERPSRDGSHEGIKVHGHWTIEVRNPDGTVVTHREFENSLAGGATGVCPFIPTGCAGAQALAGFLGRRFSVGLWLVRLDGTGLCGASSGASAACVITEGNFSFAWKNNYNFVANSIDLTVGPGNTGTDLVLSGTVTTLTAGQITGVDSFVMGCPPNSPPDTPLSAQCASLGSQNAAFSFTSRPLDGLNGDPNAMPVSSGQLIAVTVDLSFS